MAEGNPKGQALAPGLLPADLHHLAMAGLARFAKAQHAALARVRPEGPAHQQAGTAITDVEHLGHQVGVGVALEIGPGAGPRLGAQAVALLLAGLAPEPLPPSLSPFWLLRSMVPASEGLPLP